MDGFTPESVWLASVVFFSVLFFLIAWIFFVYMALDRIKQGSDLEEKNASSYYDLINMVNKKNGK